MKNWAFPSVEPGKLTVLFGLGETGLAAALWCLRHGAALRVLDTRDEPPGLDALRECDTSGLVQYCLGPDVVGPQALDGASRVVISPGIAPGGDAARPLLQAAADRGIEVIGEIELFARALADMREQGYEPRVLAITGTNGKTTVTAMTRQFLAFAGLSVQAAGNIGPAALSALLDCLDKGALPEVWVLELSSFQLVTTSSLAPHAAAVLNVSQDHLDWHGSMDAYVAAKKSILERAQFKVLNRDDPVVRGMVPELTAAGVRTFGSDAPRREGDAGMEISNGLRWLVSADGRLVRLMPADAMRVRGLHNAMNALAALLLARSLGLAWADVLGAVREYRGEPHRTESVGVIEGVEFIDDSKGTNVGATVAALEGMDRPVVLIAGGLGKGQDFRPLARAVSGHAHAVVLIGRDAPLLAAALEETGVPVELADSLELAVQRAYEQARPDRPVLLSPACASMDMFRDYRHRGQAFVQAVQGLAAESGEWA